MRLLIEVPTIILSIFFALGCSTKPEIKIQIYGIITEYNKNKIVLIEPNKYGSFDQLVNRVEQVVCNDSIPTIAVNDKDIKKWIGLANPCWEGVACLLINRRNVLKIQDEKIELNKMVELDSLGEYISRHYTNNGKSYLFSENPNKAQISVTYKDLQFTELKILVNKIIESYDKQKLETPLILTLDR